MRNFLILQLTIAVAIFGLSGTNVLAQEAEEETAAGPTAEPAEESETIEEIIVFAPKPGDRLRVDEEYEDPVRAQLLKDFYEMQEDEKELAWRQDAIEGTPSRIAWGYDPSDEYAMRNEMASQQLPSERNQPATLFRLKF